MNLVIPKEGPVGLAIQEIKLFEPTYTMIVWHVENKRQIVLKKMLKENIVYYLKWYKITPETKERVVILKESNHFYTEMDITDIAEYKVPEPEWVVK
jgi:flavorubredoxin